MLIIDKFIKDNYLLLDNFNILKKLKKNVKFEFNLNFKKKG